MSQLARPAVLALALLAGCTLGPDYKRPDVNAPSAWRPPAATVLAEAGAADLVNATWWKQFNDAELDALVLAALQENKDLLIAARRIEEYDARLQVSRSARSAQLNYAPLGNRQRLSQERIVPLPLDTPLYNNVYEISANMSWELDFWGRIRRSNEAALADLLSAEEAQRAVLMTLVSDVATGYIQLLCLDQELDLLRRTAKSTEDSVRVFTAKVEGGSATRLQLAQVRASHEQALATIPPKEREITLQENALSVLVGRNPGPIQRGATLQALAVPPVPQSIPSQILERRPDVLKAEQDLVAANARIGVAKSEYFPTISLTGNFGFSSTELRNLHLKTANFGLIGGNILGPIFDGGRIAGDVRQSEAVQRELVQAYLRAIQLAFREVEDALTMNRKSGEQFGIQGRQVEALQQYAGMARKRYEGGYSSYLDVLDAERSLFAGELARVQTQRDVYTALVAVYKSMGGGWIAEAEKMSGLERPSIEHLRPEDVKLPADAFAP